MYQHPIMNNVTKGTLGRIEFPRSSFCNEDTKALVIQVLKCVYEGNHRTHYADKYYALVRKVQLLINLIDERNQSEQP
jgi:hypothetical protein